jgi:hypothetical protein
MREPMNNTRHGSTVDIEDIEFGLQHSLALVGSSGDSLRTAGYAITNSIISRRDRLLALRHAMLALDELEHRIPLLRDELRAMVRLLDPHSELLGGPA